MSGTPALSGTDTQMLMPFPASEVTGPLPCPQEHDSHLLLPSGAQGVPPSPLRFTGGCGVTTGAGR